MTEPRWRNPDAQALRGLPPPLASWLLYEKSLTRRLRMACAGHFAVQVVSQAWQRPLLSERRLLGLPDRQRCLIRQVRLVCDRRPRVFARTIIPVSSLTGACRQLQYLGRRPLGEMLFNDARAHFCLRQIACLQPGQQLYSSATRELLLRPDRVWGRRCLYTFAGSPLLVNEVFLPDLLHNDEIPVRAETDRARVSLHAC